MSNIIPGSNAAAKISFTTNAKIEVIAPTLTKSGTVTGSSGFGSSFFLSRVFLPAAMALSEVDIGLAISFAATSEGAGTLSQSFVVYSFANSTSLASVVSASSAWVWATGTVTIAGSSYTQLQGGWTGPNVMGFTFASSFISGGEYVIGNLLNFAQGSSTWTVSLYGPPGGIMTSATLGAMSSGGLSAGSFVATSGSLAAQTAAASLAVTNVEATSTFASSASSTYSAWERMNAIARTIHTGATGTIGALSSGGLVGASFQTATGSVSAVTNVGTSIINFQYPGEASSNTVTQPPTAFIAGIFSTGAAPGAITLGTANTSLTYWGSTALQQPWFQLLGA